MARDDPTTTLVARCTRLALDGLQREYPNKIAHVLNGPGDVGTPRELTPIFYGCFDWHSAVHSHWLLVRCLRVFPDAGFGPAARELLRGHLTESNVAGEAAYLEAPGRAGFERPYGLAWLLQLCADLGAWDDDDEARGWSRALQPLELIAARRFAVWLPKLSHPVRTGEHSQTAFALGLVLDWVRSRVRGKMQRLVEERVRDLYLEDAGCSLAFEPGGQDFLSPALAEADLVRRVLEPAPFAAWLDGFLPELRDAGAVDRLQPVTVTDPTDGKLAHLDGLNLSRAWMLEGIARGLPEDDERRVPIEQTARAHRESGLAALDGDHYEGTHWLGSFAVYLVTAGGPG